jgi:hypothetical protein
VMTTAELESPPQLEIEAALRTRATERLAHA